MILVFIVFFLNSGLKLGFMIFGFLKISFVILVLFFVRVSFL